MNALVFALASPRPFAGTRTLLDTTLTSGSIGIRRGRRTHRARVDPRSENDHTLVSALSDTAPGR